MDNTRKNADAAFKLKANNQQLVGSLFLHRYVILQLRYCRV